MLGLKDNTVPPRGLERTLPVVLAAVASPLLLLSAFHLFGLVLEWLYNGRNLEALGLLVALSLGLTVLFFPPLYIPALVRATRLRRRLLNETVLTGRVWTDTVSAIHRLAGSGYASGPQIQSTAALTFDDAGITLWGGTGNPQPVIRIPWDGVRGFAATESEPRWVWHNPVIEIQLTSGEALEFWITSERRLGYDMLSREDHRRVVERILTDLAPQLLAEKSAPLAGDA